MKRIVGIGLVLLLTCGMQAAQWKTLLSYNDVETISDGGDVVYALSDGALFGVDKQTEAITCYSRMDGLHGSAIVNIYYAAEADLLLIAYEDGRIDILRNGNVEYVSGLYDKDMTATKTIRNMTSHNGKVYLSMDFGIVTFSLTKTELVDTYYIGPDAREVKVEDVSIQGDSIYAFTAQNVYKASLQDNLMDYRFWQSEALGRVQRDTQKGRCFTDVAGTIWQAGGGEGVIRQDVTGERRTYKPDGPLMNMPYAMRYAGGRLYVVVGGRWAAQYFRPGHVMIYNGRQWQNIPSSTIQATFGCDVLDMMDVVVDPADSHHFFVASYGTGLYEFRNDQPVNHYWANNSPLGNAAGTVDPEHYTRCTGMAWESGRGVWILNAGTVTYQMLLLKESGEWVGVPFVQDGMQMTEGTMGGLLLDARNPHLKWVPLMRGTPGLGLIDDAGTDDTADDRYIKRITWTNQHGQTVPNAAVYAIAQAPDGSRWVSTAEGVFYLMPNQDYFTSDQCVQLELTDEQGEMPLIGHSVSCVAFDGEGRPWIGMAEGGVYVLSADYSRIEAHYTSNNTPMPSDAILSLAADTDHETMYIGTANGIVCYTTQETGLMEKDEVDDEDIDYGTMQQWRLHNSYFSIDKMADAGDQFYAVASGALMSFDKKSEQIYYWDKTKGLNGTNIVAIAYDKSHQCLIIAYQDGRLDLLSDNGEVRSISDLYLKASSMMVTPNALSVGKKYTYLALPFGIVALGVKKGEIANTYYIGANAADVDVRDVVEWRDSIYAISGDSLYVGALQDNLLNYSFWRASKLPFKKDSKNVPSALVVAGDRLYMELEGVLYYLSPEGWQEVRKKVSWISEYGNRMLVQTTDSLFCLSGDEWQEVGPYTVNDAFYDAACGCYWMCNSGDGILRLRNQIETFTPDGPMSNIGYRLRFVGEELYAVEGGRWAAQYNRDGNISVYDGHWWRPIKAWTDAEHKGFKRPFDLVSIAGYADDPGHFFAASYGAGVYEYKNYQAIARYTVDNSTLRSAVESQPDYFTRTEGAILDEQGNLWVLNTSDLAKPLHVRTPDGRWTGLDMYSGAQSVKWNTPGEILIDNRNSQWKWMYDQRSPAVVLLDDGGTPTKRSDDHVMKRISWTDQDGLVLSPANLYCMAQDKNGDLWIGTPTGIIVIPATVDFMHSDACTRIKIRREDGTNDADYLLGTERINAIAVDGANRKWIGTENSGLYLMSADGITTLAHFTSENSNLPANSILSIAQHPRTGEVFVGTASGIASYQSDASEGKEDYSGAYAYPNPVRPNYMGTITITGLMEDSEVFILDSGGEMVCRTRSNGGTAIWDGKNQHGQRAACGVYNVLCNTADGEAHTVVKILVM